MLTGQIISTKLASFPRSRRAGITLPTYKLLELPTQQTVTHFLPTIEHSLPQLRSRIHSSHKQERP